MGNGYMIWNAIFHKGLVGAKAFLTDMVCAFMCIVMMTLFIELIRKQMEKIVARIYDNVLLHCNNLK